VLKIPSFFSGRSIPLQTADSFIKGFSWIAAFFLLARALTLLVQFVAARTLGPAEFGQAHLVVAAASLVQILPMLGFPLALSRFGASTPDEEARARTISTTLAAAAVWAAAAAGALWLARGAFSPLTGLGSASWKICLALALLTSFHFIVGGALQGLTRFKERGLAEAAYGLLAFLGFFVMLGLYGPYYQSLIAAYLAALGGAALLGLWFLRGQLRTDLDFRALKEILPYAALGTAHVLALALIQAPGRFSTFRLISAEAAGIYSAYFTATVQVSLAISGMLYAVIVPLASRPQGQRDAWAALRRGYLPAVIGGTAAFMASAFILLSLIGSRYPLRLDWLALFSLSAGLVLLHSVTACVFAAQGLRGLAVSISGTLLAGFGNLLLNLLLAPRWGVGGAAAALALGFLAGLCWYLFHLPAPEPR